MKPRGSPALTSSQEKFCPFKTTRCLRHYRKSRKSFKRIPDIPFEDNFRSNPSYHTLSKAFDVS